MTLQAHREDIVIEAKSYVNINFIQHDENFEGLNIFFVISKSEQSPEPIVLKVNNEILISGENINVPITPSESDLDVFNWYELWVEFQDNQPQKQFKGEFIASKSTNYNS